MSRNALSLRATDTPGRTDFMNLFSRRNFAPWLLLVAVIAPAPVLSATVAAAIPA